MANAATKDLLVKSLWQEGKRKEAVTVEERYDETDAVLPPALHGHGNIVDASRASSNGSADVRIEMVEIKSY
ncbi:hypothetical protein V6N13_127757 [Hibiscus sabdariffa]